MNLGQIELFIIWTLLHLGLAFESEGLAGTGGRNGETLRYVSRDMVSTQLPGLYTLISLGRASLSCPASLRVGQVEISGNARQVFVVPHSHMSVPSAVGVSVGNDNSTSTGTERVQCDSMTVTENMLTGSVSGTILRRGSDVELDRRVSLLNRLALSGGRFYVGHEHGARRCGGHTVSDSTVSVWAAPGQVVTAVADDLVLRLDPGAKYIYYFTNPPCFYRGDAAERGRVVRLASPTPSPIGVRGSGGGARPTSRPGAVTPPNDTARRPECFPGNAQVQVRVFGERSAHWESKEMRFLTVGDIVADGRGGWTRVLAETHDEDESSEVLVLMVSIQAGNSTLRLTRGHVIPTNRGLLPSGDVEVGDYVYQALGLDSSGLRGLRVSSCRMVWERGLYAPVTVSGTIQVNGLLVTTYAVRPSAAHAALAPLRMQAYTFLFPLFADKFSIIPLFVSLITRLGRWMMVLNTG